MELLVPDDEVRSLPGAQSSMVGTHVVYSQTFHTINVHSRFNDIYNYLSSAWTNYKLGNE
jgi:hypothetical protein